MPNMSQDFEKAKQYLKKSNAAGDTLYDHVTKVLLQIAKDKPEDALENFEKLSVQVKKAALDAQQYKELPTSTAKSLDERRALAAIENALKLVQSVPEVSSADLAQAAKAKAAMENKDDDADEEEVKKMVASLTPAFLKGAKVPDMQADARLLANAGVGMGKEESYKVLLSIQSLARTEGNLKSARFFGKIYGKEKDYYIVETELTSYVKEAVDPATKKEPAGTGANQYVYFATNSPEGQYTKLPDVLPEQLITARSMRRYFTGNLSAPVLGYPPFPWPEASYLRAQIGRIAAATVVSPKGLMDMAEQEDEEAPPLLVQAEEPELVDVDGLKEAENWNHHVAHLLKQGRAVAWTPPEPEEGEEEPEAEEEEEAEPEEPLPMLSGLEGDALPAKVLGDDEEEEDEETKFKLWRFECYPSSTQHRVSAAISMNWPGAVAVANGKHFANVYVGWGQKFLQTLYTPPPPPAVCKEYVSPFNPEEAEEGDVDPMLEQVDPQPPKVDDGDEGDEGDNEGDDEE